MSVSTGRGKQQRAWEVQLGKWHVDTVWFDTDMSAADVKRALVEHDGYHPRIRVTVDRMHQAQLAEESRRKRNAGRYGGRR